MKRTPHLLTLVIGWVSILGIAGSASLALTQGEQDMSPRYVRVVQAREPVPAPVEGVQHLPMPKEVRGFYMTSYSAASKDLRSGLFAYAARNHLNSVVIDVKDGGGLLAFMPTSASLKGHAPTKSTIPDLDAVLKDAGEHHLYRIARVFVFQDPDYVKRFPEEAIQKAGGGVWADHKGVTWVDAHSRAAWKYNVDLAKEVYARGFDEIQFDYIRFPSDGNMSAIVYDPEVAKLSKAETIKEFFQFMHEELEVKRTIPISYDLFGYVTWYTDFDLGIGQLLKNALPNGTAVSPMVYPSHYGNGALGYANPAEHPYEIIAYSLKTAQNNFYKPHAKDCDPATADASSTPEIPCDASLAHMRPWIQAFDIGAVYDASMIRAQIKAERDNGGDGFLLWNARNVYRDFDTAESKIESASSSKES